jgi:hypothetical protein
MVWLAITDLRQGKKLRFDVSGQPAKDRFNGKGSVERFPLQGSRAAIVVRIARFYHYPAIAFWAVPSLALNVRAEN